MYSRPSDQHPILLQYGPGGITIKTREKNTQYSTFTVLSVLVLYVYDPPSKNYNLSK